MKRTIIVSALDSLKPRFLELIYRGRPSVMDIDKPIIEVLKKIVLDIFNGDKKAF